MDRTNDFLSEIRRFKREHEIPTTTEDIIRPPVALHPFLQSSMKIVFYNNS